jgi:hypothetical protein
MKTLFVQLSPAVVGVGVSFFYFVPQLMGQAPSAMNPLGTDYLGILGQVVTPAVLAWYVIYDVRVRTPNMIAAAAAEAKAQRDSFAIEQKTARDANQKLLDEIRAAFLSEQQQTRATFLAEANASRAASEQRMREMQTLAVTTSRDMRTAVQDVKETAQAGLKAGTTP